MKVSRSSIEEIENVVLNYLENYKRVNPEWFSKSIIYCVKSSDIIKYLKNNEIVIKWGEEYTDTVMCAVERIFEKCVVEFPVVPPENEIDDFIAKMFLKNGSTATGKKPFFDHNVTISHMIKYLQRDPDIYTWNADFIIEIQREYKRCLDKMI